MDQNTEFRLEQSFLEKMSMKIKERIVQLEDMSIQQKKLVKYLFSIYTPVDTEYHTEIPVAEELSKQYSRDLTDVKKIETNPYFGKIILTLESDAFDTTLYIGKKGINDIKENEVPIIDWRAPISDVYYSCKLGKTSYQGPNDIISIDLKLKRTLKIKNGILGSIYDAEIIANDDLLLDYLSQNKGLVLNEIIATIQDEQNEIIRKPMAKNLIVQGVAGSGKTTVAIHRISYLLYSFKEMLTFENIYLIAANPLFLNYITSMLPDLDVPVIKQETMQNLLLCEFKNVSPKNFVIDNNINPIYNNNSFVPVFDAFFQQIEDSIFIEKNVTCFGSILLEDYLLENIKNKKSLSLLARSKMLDDLIMNNLVREQNRILSYITQNKDDPLVKEMVLKYFKLGGEYLFDTQLEKNYSKLKQSYRNYFTKRVKKINYKQYFIQFTDKTGAAYSLCDIACYLLFTLKIYGSKNYDDIRHIVIDEAQDFNIAIYYFLRCLFPNASFTIVGDIMQNIERDGLENWEALKLVFNSQTEYMKLLKSYRNTYEISIFTKKVMELITKKPFYIDPLKRHGDKISCISSKTPDQKKQKIKEIFSEQQSKDRKLNALICKNANEVDVLFSSLKNLENVTVLNADAASLDYGNYIVDIKSAKGLEFDSVIIWDFDSYSAEEYKMLYVAMTRALHNLFVFTNNEEIIAIANKNEEI